MHRRQIDVVNGLSVYLLLAKAQHQFRGLRGGGLGEYFSEDARVLSPGFENKLEACTNLAIKNKEDLLPKYQRRTFYYQSITLRYCRNHNIISENHIHTRVLHYCRPPQ